MYLKLAFATIPVGVILVSSEILWRKKIIKGERARKFIHILAGIWMAFWPFYVPFDGIIVLSSAAFSLLVYSRITNLFHAIYAVKRKTYGDIFYAGAIIICAYFGEADWIFTVSILLLALADGGAAVVGRFWGLNNRYFVFGSKHLQKSYAGTIAFLFFAELSMLLGWLLGGGDVLSANALVVFLFLPFGAALLENVTPYGLDNIVTPVFATLLLNSLL